MENQGFRLVEEIKQKKSYFALILSIFTVAGILFCVQQMFVDTKWWFVSMFVSIICSAFIFSTKSIKIVLVYFVLGILLLFAFRTIWISGALDFVNQVIAGFNAVTGESASYFVVPNYANRELAMVIFFCLTGWFLSGYLTIAIKGKHWVPVLVFWAALVSLAVFFEMPSAWCVGAMAFLSLAGIYAHSHTKVDEEKNYLAAYCGMVVIVAVFICFTWNRQLYHKNEIIADLKENITEEANAIRYGEKDLPEGKIKEGIALSEEKRLTVFVSEKGKYYLKGYVGSEYHENRWEPLEGKEYGEKYEGIFNRYRSDGFHPLAQLYSYCEAAGRQQNGLEKEEKEGTIVVENIGAYERYQYLPYGVDFSSIQSLDTLYRDLNLQKKFWGNREDEKNTYKICMIDEDSLLKTAGVDWQKQTITDEKVRAYADMEMDYRKFVKKHYLALSKKAKEEVAPYVPQKKDNLVSYIEKIRSSLKNAGKEKGDWDALQYASLGTLAFRAANIPARYVEGYEAVTSDEKDANGNYRADVTGQNAHAWVEIYCDGVGWLPVDVTPGHYDKITVKAKQQKKIEKQQTSISQKVTKKKEKPKQNEAPNKYLSWQQIVLWIVICIFAVSFLFAGVLAIRRKAMVYKRRKTLMQADTAANYRFIISYLTTLFAYLKLSEEDLPREIREGMERFWFDENGEITEKELSQLREYGNEIQNTMWQESSCIKKLVLRFWHCFEFPF